MPIAQGVRARHVWSLLIIRCHRGLARAPGMSVALSELHYYTEQSKPLGKFNNWTYRGAGMRAVQFYEFGDPAKVLKLIEAEKPSPKPGEAFIRMQLRPINPFEFSLVGGTYRIKPPLLAAVGFEGGGGVVEELGDGAS